MSLSQMVRSPDMARPAVTWAAPPLSAVGATTANGLRVMLAENHTVPIVWLNWVCRAGHAYDPPALGGLAALTPHLLRAGAAERTATQITELVDDLGATLIAGSDWDEAFLNLQLLSADLAVGAKLLMDMVCHPRFPRAAVAQLQRQRLAELQHRRRDPRAAADDAFARAIYGATGYGRSPLGEPDTVRAIDVTSLSSFHDVHYAPACSCLVVAGHFDADRLVDLLSDLELPPASGRSLPLPRLAAAPPASSDQVQVMDVPGATHAELRVGHASVERASGDLAALTVLNAVLGGGPSSRLTRSLRHRSGLTYHVRSQFAARRHGGPFVVETGVATEAATTAVTRIREEVDRLREELVPAAEVDRAKSALFGAELQRLQSIVGTGLVLGPAALDGDPTEYFERRRRAIGEVGPETIRTVARRHLHPDRLTVVAAGCAGDLRSQFPTGRVVACEPPATQSTS
jgi:zinc protease